jgi:hypothetical protein
VLFFTISCLYIQRPKTPHGCGSTIKIKITRIHRKWGDASLSEYYSGELINRVGGNRKNGITDTVANIDISATLFKFCNNFAYRHATNVKIIL